MDDRTLGFGTIAGDETGSQIYTSGYVVTPHECESPRTVDLSVSRREM